VGEVVNRCPCSAAAAAKGHLDFFFGKQGSTVRHDGHGKHSIDATIATRAKMGQSSDVFAVAIMADGRALFAKKEIKVTLGGCGG